MKPITRVLFATTLLMLMLVQPNFAADMGTAFTYQGFLSNGSGAVTDTCDFRFQLYDAAAAGNLKGTNPQDKPAVAIVGGVFTVSALDFGDGAIDGTARWLEINVCCPSPCAPTLLTPRVELTAAPHALALPGVFPDTASGNVGVNTISPTAALHVGGTAGVDGIKFPDGTLQTTAAIGGGGNTLDQAYDQGGPGAGRIITADSGAVEIAGPSGLRVAGTIQSGSSITIDGTSGNERISSSASLDFRTAAGRALRLENNAVSPNIIGGHSANL
jgi:hypothetical protein